MKTFASNDEIAPCLSVVMPVYNEEATVLEMVQLVLAQRPVQQLVIVDDCSKDGTWNQLSTLTDPRVSIHRHEVNKGKGAALRTGFEKVTSPWMIIQDADREYSPEEYHLLLAPALAGLAAVVFGSRFLGGTAHRVLYFWHMVGNRLLTLLSNVTTNLNLTDMETCYKLWRRDIITQVAPTLQEKRFGFEPEVTAKVAKIPNVRIYEVGISYFGRSYDEGKKINWKDGVSAVRCIVKYGLGKR